MPFKVKFIYSEKATNNFKISAIDLSYVVSEKSTVEILQHFVTFSEYMNFKKTSNFPFVDNPKKLASASKQDKLVLPTLWYFRFLSFKYWVL